VIRELPIAQQRQAVIREAETWLRTPWHHAAAVKGAGVDCGQILIEIFAACGLIERPQVGYYPRDWALHRDEERYLAVLESYARRIDTPQPGDIVVYRYGRSYSHGGLVTCWPTIIHAHVDDGVVYANGQSGGLNGRPLRFYSIWEG
jgi:cell wall-associated NlpC family hydrolase